MKAVTLGSLGVYLGVYTIGHLREQAAEGPPCDAFNLE